MAKAQMTAISCALAIGGLDPGGGAGIVADLRAFTAAGAFGCAAVAVLTVQSTAGLVSARALSPREVLAQAREVLAHQRVRAIKIGALGSADNVLAVARLLGRHAAIPAVLDPVMIPTRGRARLLETRALDAMRTRLVPRAALITANAPEAEALTGNRVSSLADAERAALELSAMGARAALVKGGHLAGDEAVDTLVVGTRVHRLARARLPRLALHGGGCFLASLIAGRLAMGHGLVDAVRWAKSAHHARLRAAVDVGGPLRVL
jgi:hydroxymethylpyrimidine kinase/phosphomethylpyrimidine kinase